MRRVGKARQGLERDPRAAEALALLVDDAHDALARVRPCGGEGRLERRTRERRGPELAVVACGLIVLVERKGREPILGLLVKPMIARVGLKASDRAEEGSGPRHAHEPVGRLRRSREQLDKGALARARAGQHHIRDQIVHVDALGREAFVAPTAGRSVVSAPDPALRGASVDNLVHVHALELRERDRTVAQISEIAAAARPNALKDGLGRFEGFE